MAKVNDLKKGLGNLKKKPVVDEKTSERVERVVHPEVAEVKQTSAMTTPKKRGRKKVNVEETIRYTIDLPKSVHKALKHKLADEGGTMRSVVIRLLRKELDIK